MLYVAKVYFLCTSCLLSGDVGEGGVCFVLFVFLFVLFLFVLLLLLFETGSHFLAGWEFIV